ncbi:hypothetical protein HPB49_010793 [Dermacentor silvarum]|uniref:Uncharacterized protein n=1 Tax=Dermacentor silvarum TaxID=543639 RepID=A0ACB8DCK6_DERSI|nr:hypothetical protein HPB49_010793 [Dermacentor silvarum]
MAPTLEPRAVVPETWLAGIRKHGRAEYDASTGVITTIQYLRVAGLVLRPEKRFAMRKLIAWHLLRSLVAPKDLCLAAYNAALVNPSSKFGPDVVTSDTICKEMLEFTSNIRGHAIYLLEGSDAVPLERLLEVTLMMARIQRTIAVNRLGAARVRSTDEDTSLKSVSFPKVAVSSNTSGVIPNLFARVDALPGGFIADWLRRQRAWHGLPPILQGHLAALSLAAVDFKEVLGYFRPPYYYEDGLASYNYAVLGQAMPLFGYLRADTQDSCYGVVTVRSSDTEATLRESLYWPEGEILHVRQLGTSNKVRLTFSGKVKPRYVSYDTLLIPVQPYKKTVPACGRCGSVGHRPDSCPSPKPDLCGICGKAVPLKDGARAPHECTPRCALCAGPHITADRCCKERYRAPPPKSPIPPPEGQAGPKKRKLDAHGNRGRRALGLRLQMAQPPATNPTPPPHPDAGAIGPSLRGQTPDGPPTRKSTTRQVSPASPKPHPPSTEPKPTAKGDLPWATRVRQGPQVSGSGGAASPPPPSMIPNPKPPTPSTPTREQIAIRQLQAQVASLTQAVEALANRLPSANPTPSGQAPEAMDSASSEHRDTTAILAPIEARVSSLEDHVASIVTTIEDRLAAALQTVVDRIPGMTVAAVDRQSKVSITTSDVSTGPSSRAPMDLSALLEAPQISSFHDGGQRL